MVISGYVASKKGASNDAIVPNVQLSAIELHLRLAAALYPYWEWQGSISEGRKWLEAALMIPLADEPESSVLAARADALYAAAQFIQTNVSTGNR
jgi:hypothetical protein